MREVLSTVQRWRRSGANAMVARIVGGQGPGAWAPGGALVVSDTGETAGALLGGAVTEPVVEAARAAMSEGRVASRLAVSIGQDEAMLAGLACGGEARIAIQSISSLPEVLWSDLASNRSVALIVRTEAGPEHAERSFVIRTDGETAGSLGDPALEDAARDVVREMLLRPKPDVRVMSLLHTAVAVEVFGSFPHVVVVGGGDLAVALDAQCAALGWPCVHVDGVADSASKLAELGSSGALVLLSHDPEVDEAVLATALMSGAGYVGALGSHHTQRQRAQRLEQLGVDEASRSRIYGPIGLDLGARNPVETALSICAEILGTATGGVSGSLRDTDGPIHR